MFKNILPILLVGSSLLCYSADNYTETNQLTRQLSPDEVYLAASACNCLPSDIPQDVWQLFCGFFSYFPGSTLKKIENIGSTFRGSIGALYPIETVKGNLNSLAETCEGHYFSKPHSSILRLMTNMDRTSTTFHNTTAWFEAIFSTLPDQCFPPSFTTESISCDLTHIKTPDDAFPALQKFLYDFQQQVLIPYLNEDLQVSITFTVAQCFNLPEEDILARNIARKDLIDLIKSTTPFQRLSVVKHMSDFDLLHQYTRPILNHINRLQSFELSDELHEIRDSLFEMFSKFKGHTQNPLVIYLENILGIIGLYIFIQDYTTEEPVNETFLGSLRELKIEEHLLSSIQARIQQQKDSRLFDRKNLTTLFAHPTDLVHCIAKKEMISVKNEFIRLMELTKRPVDHAVRNSLAFISVYGLFRLIRDHQGPLIKIPTNLDKLSKEIPIKKEVLEYEDQKVARNASYFEFPLHNAPNARSTEQRKAYQSSAQLHIDNLLKTIKAHLNDLPKDTKPQNTDPKNGINIHKRDKITEKNCTYFMAFMNIVNTASGIKLNTDYCMDKIAHLKHKIINIPITSKITLNMKNNAVSCISQAKTKNWPTLVETDGFMRKYNCTGIEFITNVINFIHMHSPEQQETLMLALIPALSEGLGVCGDGKVQRIMIATLQGWLHGINIDGTNQDPFTALCESNPQEAAKQMMNLFFSNPKYQGEEGIGGNRYTRSNATMNRFLDEFIKENPNIPAFVQKLLYQELKNYLDGDFRSAATVGPD